jgi:tetratricopeptide (TPR) repeat protein
VEPHQDRAGQLGNLARSLQLLGERTEDATLLAEAVQTDRDALALLRADDIDLPRQLDNLAGSLASSYGRTGQLTAPTEAVRMSRLAVAAGSSNSRLRYLDKLSHRLRTLAERTGDATALAEANQAARDASAGASSHDSDPAQRAAEMSADLLTWYKHSGQFEALTGAVQAAKDAVALAADNAPERPAYLNHLANVLMDLFEDTQDATVLRDAVQAARDSVVLTPLGHPVRGVSLSVLGNALSELFDRTDDTATIAEAVRAYRDAVAAAADNPSRLIGFQSNLSVALDTMFERTGDIAALTEALAIQRAVVAATADDDPSRASSLHNLGSRLMALAERTGDFAALPEAVQAYRDALAACPPGHPDRAGRLSHLGIALQGQFEQTGDSTALSEALRAHRDTVDVTPIWDSGYPVYLLNLSSALLDRARRMDDSDAADEAADLLRLGLASVPDDHPSRRMFLDNLGTALHRLYHQTGEVARLEEAVRAVRDAVTATPPDHPDLAGDLNNLSGDLRELYFHSREPAMLAEAVQTARDAVAATPPDHPNLAMYLNTLGVALRMLAESTGDTPAIVEAWQCFLQSADITSAPASSRIGAYRRAAAVAARAGRSPGEVLATVEAAVALLPQAAARTLARADQEHSLRQLNTLAGQAAAAAVEAGQPARAVELLEQTRGVLVADRLDARSSDLARLRRHSPALAAEFDRLRSLIDSLDRPRAVPTAPDDGLAGERAKAAQRADACAALDELVATVRATADFTDFFRPPRISQLAGSVQDGPVVFCYLSPDRCDALILTGDAQVGVVPLGLTEQEAIQQADRLLNALRAEAGGSGLSAQAEILDLLGWIWDAITEPVLTALGHTASPAPGVPWPQVWWCPVGVLAYLPLHAAGHHHEHRAQPSAGPAQPRTVLDRVVSSHIGTVRGLGYARAQRLPSAAAAAPLIIAVPDAPGAPPLPGARDEARSLAELFPAAVVLPRPTRDTVLAALPGHPIAHFACHGESDWDDPAASHLVLYDHGTAPLTIGEISALRLAGGLAYLSACETALGSPALVNEGVHITGAFHLAGYQHVVGTLWPIDDTIAAAMAQDFYSRLTKEGTAPPDISRASQVLHETIRELRDIFPSTPTLWAAHVHTGI